MTPQSPNVAVIQVRLRMIRRLLDQLAQLGAPTPEDFEADPIRRAGAERFIQVIADLAVDINSHVAVAVLGEAPLRAADSWSFAARAGLIDDETTKRLQPSTGMRNVLVHQYIDIDVPRVAAAVPLMIDGYGEYVRQVAAFLLRLEDEQASS